MKKILHEPLFYFVLIAGFIFGFYALVTPPTESDTHIEITEQNLLTFMQYRSKTFQPSLAKKTLDGLEPAALDRLIEEYVEQEALYREAISLGLDNNDDIIRRRLLQKIEYIAKGFNQQQLKVDDAELEQFYQQHLDLYQQPAKITFKHTFFDQRKDGGLAQATARATAFKQQLNQAIDQPAKTPDGFADRFIYLHKNYVEKEYDLVSSHFGETFTSQVFKLPVDGQWHGPIRSDHGAHLVQVLAVTERRQAPFEEVVSRVVEDWQRTVLQQKLRDAFQSIVKEYPVKDYYRKK